MGDEPEHQETFDPMPGRVLLGGVIGMVIGSFAPWGTVSVGAFSVSKNGIDGDGVITLVLAVAIAALGYPLLRERTARGRAIALLVVAAVAVAACIYEIGDIESYAEGEILPGVSVETTVAWGLWLTTAGAATSLIAGVLAARKAK